MATQNLLVCRSEKKFEKHFFGFTHKTVNHRRHFVDSQGINYLYTFFVQL